jgi:hypothetical protein
VGRTSKSRPDRLPLTTAIATGVATMASTAPAIDHAKAPRVTSGRGPAQPTRARAANQPPVAPIMTTTAASGTALPAKAIGPPPPRRELAGRRKD